MRTPSPDMDSMGGVEIKLLAGLHGEGVVPGVQIADGVGAILVGSVPVGRDLAAHSGVSDLLPPALREADEKALIAAQAVLVDIRLPAQRQMVRVVRGQQTGHVGDIFAERLVPVYSEVGEWTVGVELGGE